MGTIYPKRIQEAIHGTADKKIQVGYSKAEIRHENGNKWTDEYGKEWEMKDGIVQSIPKLSDVRVPLFCPKCGGVMGKSSKDTEVFYKFGFCLKCLLDRDCQMQKDGTFAEYEKNYVKSKKKGFYEEAKHEIESYLTQMREKGHLEYVDGEGQIKKMDVNINNLIKFWEEELEEVNKELEKIDKK